MTSETEVLLINQNEQLKKRIRDMEELFAAQDDDNRGRLEDVMEQKKELTAKNAALESRMFRLAEENAELKETLENLPTDPVPQQQEPVQPASNLLSESFVNEYTDLQDKVDELNEEKITLQSKIRELENDIVNMVQRLESLESTNADLTDALSSVNKEKKRLCQENKDLVESVTMMQMQIDTMCNSTPVDQKERGNSLFGEVDDAREKAEKELKKVVEQNVLLQNEIDTLQIKIRRYANSNLTHADQAEIDFQKKHSEQTFSQLQEYIKTNQRYAEQIDDLTKKLIALEGYGNENAKMSSMIVKRQLEMANNELARLRKVVDKQNIELHHLGVLALKIPTLESSIKRYESKVSSLEDEIQMMKDLNNANNKALLSSKPNDENVSPSLNLFEVPSTPKEPRRRPRLVSPSKTQPAKSTSVKWADQLKSQYKQTAKQLPNRERSMDFRRGSRLPSLTKDPKI